MAFLDTEMRKILNELEYYFISEIIFHFMLKLFLSGLPHIQATSGNSWEIFENVLLIVAYEFKHSYPTMAN